MALCFSIVVVFQEQAPASVLARYHTFQCLAKPDPNLFETKRKAVTPPALDTHELHPFGFKKKPQEEWSCALCQVTATSEKGLNQHLRGRKHKAREAGLVSQKVGKSPINAPSRKKTGNPSKATETVGAANSKLGAEVEGKPLEQNQTANTLNKKKQGVKRKLKQLIREEQNAGELNMTSRSETVKTADGTAEQEMMKAAKKYRFWCETCQVGSQSSKVMEDHERGKKHTARLRCEPSKSSVADLISTNTPSEAVVENPTYSTIGNKAIVEKPKDSNLEDQGNEKTTTDNVADANKSTPVEKPKDSNVENQANDKTTDDVSNTDKSAPVDKPKDSNEENQASEKTTGDVSSTDNPTPTPTPSPSPSPSPEA
ncbi:Zinc finger, double-stranded RNA binding [Trema orientale]|uniref:Zinc finger, double-stranded RNA binding n=1 Tax=Trema orientale TaxID=63057 RepID=A0A2P5FNL3_TREOI|nr:Zinc finger, double-stranded RNA binding [Trema orientale]